MAPNFADLFEHAVDAVPDRVALIVGDRQVTFRELDAHANRLAHHFVGAGFGEGSQKGHVPCGYYSDPVRSAEVLKTIDGDRVVVTGDRARTEGDGTITLLGRGNSVVNTGGEEVFVEEVEAVLEAHPGVYAAIVVGVPDERWGQRVAAVVRPREAGVLDFGDGERHARNTLAGYKISRSIWLSDTIERTPAASPTIAGYMSTHRKPARTTASDHRVHLTRRPHVDTALSRRTLLGGAGVQTLVLERGLRWPTGPDAQTFPHMPAPDHRASWLSPLPVMTGAPPIPSSPYTGLMERVKGIGIDILCGAGVGGRSLLYAV